MSCAFDEPEMIEVTGAGESGPDVRTFEDGNRERWVLIRASYFVYLLALAHRHEPSELSAVSDQRSASEGSRGAA